MSLHDLDLKYQAKPAEFKHSAVLITVNKYFRECKTPEELYDRTRSAWVMSIEKAQRVDIACALYRGIIREVYILESWHRHPDIEGRIYFEGKVADDKIRKLYLNKSVKHLIKPGASNPIRYVWV